MTQNPPNIVVEPSLPPLPLQLVLLLRRIAASKGQPDQRDCAMAGIFAAAGTDGAHAGNHPRRRSYERVSA